MGPFPWMTLPLTAMSSQDPGFLLSGACPTSDSGGMAATASVLSAFCLFASLNASSSSCSCHGVPKVVLVPDNSGNDVLWAPENLAEGPFSCAPAPCRFYSFVHVIVACAYNWNQIIPLLLQGSTFSSVTLNIKLLRPRSAPPDWFRTKFWSWPGSSESWHVTETWWLIIPGHESRSGDLKGVFYWRGKKTGIAELWLL
jgi:hypothetical protein